MATAKRVFNQIELNFWNIAIPLMSETPELQQVVRLVGRQVAKYRGLPNLLRSAIWALGGGLLGLMAGIFAGLVLH